MTGTKEVMELGGIRALGEEKVFLTSTTHGAETSGMAACMATIDEFKNKDVVAHNHKIGNALHTMSCKIIQDKNLAEFVSVNDTDWWPIFTFKDAKKEVSAGMKTLVMQEMISNGVLFNGSFVPCFSHSMTDVQFFGDALSESLDIYAKALESGYEAFLSGPVIKPVFRKYL
jgi:glutamate-1-semialdehyde aminotransferase